MATPVIQDNENTLTILGRKMKVMKTEEGPRALGKGKTGADGAPLDPAKVQAYFHKAFGKDYLHVKRALMDLASSCNLPCQEHLPCRKHADILRLLSRSAGKNHGTARSVLLRWMCEAQTPDRRCVYVADKDKDELDGDAYALYEQFRHDIPDGAKGWGHKGFLSLPLIRSLQQ